MNNADQYSAWQGLLKRPQNVWFRRALFQVHLWSGVSLGLYMLFISVTGSVLVYRNELYVLATPAPIISTAAGLPLSDTDLTAAAMRSYPGSRVVRISRAADPNQAVDVWVDLGNELKKRLFDPISGADVGGSDAIAITLVSKLIELHDDLLAGPAGRKVNGFGALAVLITASTGLIIWWPGLARWRRSLVVNRNAGWKRLNWELHSAVGFWSFGFVLILGASGLYLCFPEVFHASADWLEPPTNENAGTRFVDSVLYWLAYLHFGRINGIGIPCNGPGVCDQAVKAVWAVFGLAPAIMFVTGTTMWWNRVVRPMRKRALSSRRR